MPARTGTATIAAVGRTLKFSFERKHRFEPWELDPEVGEQILAELRHGHTLSDRRLDRLFSPKARDVSPQHWTPIAVARRAAEILSEGENRRLLDVGSGVGKFCLVGALTTASHFVGVERRDWLVRESRNLARRFGIERVDFLQGGIRQVDWDWFDGFYFYNPFYEHLEAASRIDEELEQGQDAFRKEILWVTERLAGLRDGTRVVTFHGFGGKLPASYECQGKEIAGDDFLELWVKCPTPANETATNSASSPLPRSSR